MFLNILLIREKQIKWILVALAFAALPLQAQSPDLFPKPPQLQSAVDFWVRVYTEVNTQSGFLHDSRNLSVIYERLQLNRNEIERVRSNIRDDLMVLASGKRDGLTSRQQDILDLWPANVSNQILRTASDNVRWQLGQSDRFLGGLQRSGAYKSHINEVIRQKNLPIELGVLPHVESSFNPSAYSSAAAAGMWQFTPVTGKRFMRIDYIVDERMDPYRATVAACEFFEKSYSVYGDWSLVLASYNSGRGNVNKAIRRSGGKRSYWQIRRFLPKETRSYVPAFIAVCYAMNYASDHKICSKNPRVLFHEVDTVEVKYQIDFEFLSSSLDISIDELEFLNPSYKINVIPKVEGRPYHLVLPIDKMGVFVSNEKEIYAHFIELDAQKRKNYPIYSEQDERIVHRVKGGEYLGKIARRYGCSVKKIQQWNNLKNDNIRVGQRLILYVRPDYV